MQHLRGQWSHLFQISVNMSDFTSLIDQHRPELDSYIELYKHFHANPELSYLEHETAAKIEHTEHRNVQIHCKWDGHQGGIRRHGKAFEELSQG